jgi:predicted GNAT family acetyltransferase
MTAEQAEILWSGADAAPMQACQFWSPSAAIAGRLPGDSAIPSREAPRHTRRRIFVIPPYTRAGWSPICIAGFTDIHGSWISFQELAVMTTADVRDNKSQHRFELDVEGAVAFANYRLAPGSVIITHTETPPALRGRGIASKLVQGALEIIRADGLKVVAGCGFVVDYLQKHPEFADLT